MCLRHAKTAARIDIQFGTKTPQDPGDILFDWGPDCPQTRCGLREHITLACSEDKVCEERRQADDKMADSRAAYARAAVARASAHVSRAEERVAILDCEAAQAALQATQAAERAKVGFMYLYQ